MLTSVWSAINSRLFRIDSAEVSFERRGFQSVNESSRIHLERVGSHFLKGYHAALRQQSIDRLGTSLNQVEPAYRGFAFEGAAMALAILDAFSFALRRRWQEFVDGPGAPHRYVCHVGYGWVLARFPWLRLRGDNCVSRFDPLLKWLVLDGYGFHEGYFHCEDWLPPSNRRPAVHGYAARAFDQGLGRSLWFVAGGNPCRIPGMIGQFHLERRADLWSGVGIACAYAGEPTSQEIASLLASAGGHLIDFAQGVAFGAEARELGGIPMEHTNRSCLAVCGIDAHQAAELTCIARRRLPIDSKEQPAYEEWRAQVRNLLQRTVHSCA